MDLKATGHKHLSQDLSTVQAFKSRPRPFKHLSQDLSTVQAFKSRPRPFCRCDLLKTFLRLLKLSRVYRLGLPLSWMLLGSTSCPTFIIIIIILGANNFWHFRGGNV